jgi:hypothetical protein
MHSSLQPGLAIKAKSTDLNQKHGIDAAAARGRIRKADEKGISVYLERGNNRGWLEVVMTPETFSWNFEEDYSRPDDISSRISKHYSKRYPEDL